MRFLFKAFIVLFLLNSFLFFVHYRDSGIVSAKKEEKLSYDQEIEVVHRENELLIRHHFTKLSTERLEIAWPKESEKRTCHVEDTDSCARLNEEATAFVEGEETAQSISYSIPKESAIEESVFFQAVFAEIHEANPQATVLHIVDEVHEDGLWITGLQQVGNQTLNLVNYLLFSGNDAVSDLYWQREQLPSESNEYATVYGANSMSLVTPYEKLFTTLKAPHTTVIFSESSQQVVSSRFIITDGPQFPAAMQEFAVNQFYMKYKKAKVDPFTAEVLIALLIDDEADLSLAPTAVGQLKSSLTDTQIRRFVSLFEETSTIASAEVIDGFIQEVTGYKTSFFTTNSQLEEGYYPFLLENPKKLVVSNGEPLESYAVVQDNQTYYPIRAVMESLGYRVALENASLYIESATNNYRFPLKRHFYVLNDRRFNTQKLYVKEINNRLYFEESTMLRIFQLRLENKEDEIKLMPLAG